ncbi:MAG: phosphotransferase [Chloroflexi bacterium]|nr:phosphotransferase [Chloroflexota bacterium]
MAAGPLSPGQLNALVSALAPGGRALRIRPLRGGMSTSVHRVRLANSVDSVNDVVIVRFDADWHRADPDIARCEFKLLQALAQTDVPVAEPLLVDDGSIFGWPTLVTTRLPGRTWLNPPPSHLEGYIRSMANLLVRVHSLGIADLDFVPRQIPPLDRTLAEASELPDPIERAVWRELHATRPESCARRVLVHNDYWPGNLLWRRGRLVGLVDWEAPRLGDAGRDVGTCHGDASMLFGHAAAERFLENYIEAGGEPGENLRFWKLYHVAHALGELDSWLPGLHALGRTDFTLERLRSVVQEMGRVALDS